MSPAQVLGSSFRDPAGFVFSEEGQIKRVVTRRGREDYDKLLSSGLYDQLVRRQWLVSHEEVRPQDENFYKVIVPQPVPVISYPYEWCFSQLKDAALLTLDIQLLAVEHGMSLKDANPFNIQWIGNSPILIDTLSFERLRERPWFAYRQFCETFLAPLAMMNHVKPDFNKYLSVDLGGMNLSYCSQSLPAHTWLRFGTLAHIHLHALSQQKFNRSTETGGGPKNLVSMRFSKTRLISLINHLRSLVSRLSLIRQKSAFGDYYAECGHYPQAAEQFKKSRVEAWALESSPSLVLDLGGNNGMFSRPLTRKGIRCVCADSDPYCVEENYLISKRDRDSAMLPLMMDLANPSPDLGWDGNERPSFLKRVKPDLVLALALIHHLRITGNVSVEFIAGFFSKVAPHLIIEFVPKKDPMAQRLLANRDDIFHDYSQAGFEEIFSRSYVIEKKTPIPETERALYSLRRR